LADAGITTFTPSRVCHSSVHPLWVTGVNEWIQPEYRLGEILSLHGISSDVSAGDGLEIVDLTAGSSPSGTALTGTLGVSAAQSSSVSSVSDKLLKPEGIENTRRLSSARRAPTGMYGVSPSLGRILSGTADEGAPVGFACTAICGCTWKKACSAIFWPWKCTAR
jgi:hypothetical protein